ncbi:MAG: glycosyltransferase [Chloroflexi bacterium]|nr:MAG: glycosyltransferase [Chloroflexota bacterium]MBL1192819.1 glycosyltransferase [Chloroflexota bacterium]NOH10112.1 glycosyltransferase [Chloroflexota bacterium]
MPAVSVILPCYNATATLNETLESLAAQTHHDFEIVAVDDGSTDGTADMLATWAQSEPRLRVITQEHAGVIGAANTALANCESTYVARMDADDRAHPERLAKQAAYLDAHPDVGVVGCLVRGFPESELREGFRIYIDWLNSLVSNEDIRREMFVESPIANPSAIFRKELVLDAGGYQDRGWPEDYDLWLRLYLSGAKFAKVPEVLLDWRDHPTRLTRADSRYSLENFIRTKAHYIAQGPLVGRDAVILWGAGMMGKRVSKHLLRAEVPLVVFVDVDKAKIGRTRRGLPIVSPDELMEWWGRYENPALLAAVGARGARKLIRARLNEFGLVEGKDWWGVA